MNPMSPLYVPAGEGPCFELGDHRGFVKVSADHTNGVFMLVECHADYNGGVPPHIHYREEETFSILTGRVEFTVGGQTIEAGPGDTVFGPRGVEHTWRCVSEEGARMLIFFTPGANFQEFGMAMAATVGGAQAAMATPEGAAAFMALATKHGIEMLPPGK